jgi:hypothetical protein
MLHGAVYLVLQCFMLCFQRFQIPRLFRGYAFGVFESAFSVRKKKPHVQRDFSMVSYAVFSSLQQRKE